MIKLICMFAMASIAAASTTPMQVVEPAIFRPAAAEAPIVPTKETLIADTTAAENANDMEKAETFGFGFHKHIHLIPNYGGYYRRYYPYYRYPSYGYGYNYDNYGHPYHYY